jgi:hypothetical protein
MKKNVLDWLRQTLLLTLGSAVCALAVKAIMMEQGLLAAGLTGAALVVHYIHPDLPVALIYLLINIPVFLVGWRLVGLRFLGYSLWGMLIYALLLWALPWRIELGDPMLAAVVAGGLSGASPLSCARAAPPAAPRSSAWCCTSSSPCRWVWARYSSTWPYSPPRPCSSRWSGCSIPSSTPSSP